MVDRVIPMNRDRLPKGGLHELRRRSEIPPGPDAIRFDGPASAKPSHSNDSAGAPPWPERPAPDPYAEHGWNDARGDARDDAGGQTGGRSFGRLRVLSPADCDAAPGRDYLVKGMIARGDLALLVAVPGAGKSVIAPFLGYAIAQGMAAWSTRIRQASVAYLAAEDGVGMTMRVKALRRRLGDAPDFHLVPNGLDLFAEDGDVEDVRAFLRAVKPGLIVVDTLNRAFHGLRENEGEDMDRVIRVARSLAAECNAAVLLIHHPSKADPREPRGHSSLNAAADVTMFIQGGTGEPKTISFGKNRNGSSLATFGFRIDVETLGLDSDGDPITAPVAVLNEAAEPTRERDVRRSLPAAQRTAMELLDRAVIKEGGTPPPSSNVPPDVPGVPVEVWRAYCYRGQVTTGESDSARRKSFIRAANQLQAKGLIGQWAGWVWVAAKPKRDMRDMPDYPDVPPDVPPTPWTGTNGTNGTHSFRGVPDVPVPPVRPPSDQLQ